MHKKAHRRWAPRRDCERRARLVQIVSNRFIITAGYWLYFILVQPHCFVKKNFMKKTGPKQYFRSNNRLTQSVILYKNQLWKCLFSSKTQSCVAVMFRLLLMFQVHFLVFKNFVEFLELIVEIQKVSHIFQLWMKFFNQICLSQWNKRGAFIHIRYCLQFIMFISVDN